MSIRQADKKPGIYENCVTVGRQKFRPNAIHASKSNDAYEAKQRYVVTIGECRSIHYRRLKKNEVPPVGAIIHTGKI
jgi:hypothetical protein